MMAMRATAIAAYKQIYHISYIYILRLHPAGLPMAVAIESFDVQSWSDITNQYLDS